MLVSAVLNVASTLNQFSSTSTMVNAACIMKVLQLHYFIAINKIRKPNFYKLQYY